MALIEKTERLIECLRSELQQYGEMLALLDQQQANVVRRVADDLLITAAAIDTQSAAVQKARQRLIATLVPVQQDPLYDGHGHLSAAAPRGSSLDEAVG